MLRSGSNIMVTIQSKLVIGKLQWILNIYFFSFNSEEDVLQWVMAQVDRSKNFEICVSRDDMVDRGLKLWKRRKNGSPLNPLKVSFLGEPGVDTGALRKEFLSSEWYIFITPLVDLCCVLQNSQNILFN